MCYLNIHNSSPDGYHLSIPPLLNGQMNPKPPPVTSLLLHPPFLLAHAHSAIREILSPFLLRLPLLAVLGLFLGAPRRELGFPFLAELGRRTSPPQLYTPLHCWAPKATLLVPGVPGSPHQLVPLWTNRPGMRRKFSRFSAYLLFLFPSSLPTSFSFLS